MLVPQLRHENNGTNLDTAARSRCGHFDVAMTVEVSGHLWADESRVGAQLGVDTREEGEGGSWVVAQHRLVQSECLEGRVFGGAAERIVVQATFFVEVASARVWECGFCLAGPVGKKASGKAAVTRIKNA
ncbi:unnamed protein product [Lampetra fluviatilis]